MQDQRSELSTPSVIDEPNNFTVGCSHHHSKEQMMHSNQINQQQTNDSNNQQQNHMQITQQTHNLASALIQHQVGQIRQQIEQHSCRCTHYHHNVMSQQQQQQQQHYHRSNCSQNSGFMQQNYPNNQQLHNNTVTNQSVEMTRILSSPLQQSKNLVNHQQHTYNIPSNVSSNSQLNLMCNNGGPQSNQQPQRPSSTSSFLPTSCDCGGHSSISTQHEQSGRSSRIVSTDENNPSGSEDSGRKCTARINK